MIKHKCETKKCLSFFIGFAVIFLAMSVVPPVHAEKPKPIVISEENEDILQRMKREISLDVRDMNIVDVIKFLALKGEFNVVVSPMVDGRSTVLLNNVSIQDALDIVIISNHLAYKIMDNIVHIMAGAEYEAMFGKRFNDMSDVAIIHLNYSKPTYVLAALDNLKSNVGKIIIDDDTGSVVMIDTPEALARMKDAIKEIEKPVETYVYALQFAMAADVAEKLRGRIDAKSVGSVTPDTRSNKLLIRAYPDRLKEIKEIIRSLDTPTKEVMVNARVLQIVLRPEYDRGLDWQMNFADSSNDEIKKLSFSNFFLGSQNSAISGSDNLYKQYGQIAVGNITQDAFQTTIRQLKQVSDTKILSNPQILVTNETEAKIHIGDTVPYIISTTSGTGDNAITSEDVRFVDVGLQLNVKPTINDDGYVTMRLRPEISSVVSTVESEGGGIPQVNKTEVDTTVMVKDGNTIILGGLKKDDKTHTKKGFPTLMDVPVLGFFFGRTTDQITSTEIVILITPNIINAADDYKKMQGNVKPFKSYSSDTN